ncbi:hypothetical protein HN51_070037 [Arachis hypogaea]|uniref:DNL-type domain-containing protein n=1 Tax=Arachis hypogaea TaxID=3818 RepID=A0A444Z3H9_ARAHY|nr:mitochondrial protein import protein ZIM17 [Arachis ipaensis]XP_020979878.1 mitochondrial protein import protein ZIM17 [Arachis ipaensis]XP_020979879.1 mitochondrial protein import protein ZIM17 [Arachis ipaensis]XP_025655048.1 mitochondrial protein import protein ZIM17 isoform X1 [Arachis hypogaea]XP_025655049.1 mitochondrial protein import protein ZIM17 isoform X1 [Arachis hypogaea]XP_025655050.1 mitochondrial protein import protein ZIM17 isoform X1 [Arachis hypogaea]RYR08757.1 hypotheti
MHLAIRIPSFILGTIVFQLPMAASTHYTIPLFLPSLSSSTHKVTGPINSLCFSLPFSASKFNTPSIGASRSKIFLSPRLAGRVCMVNGLLGDDSFTSVEPESKNSEEGASIDLNLPRRSLLVQFTCNLCGERTERLVNRLAYERGSVFVQCAGCLRHHKLVDNLGLITEYDFRGETESEVDQI